MKTIPCLFTKKLHICNDACSSIQCWCLNLETNEYFWLGFSKSSKMFKRVWNVRFLGEFTEIITYSEDYNNRVKIIKDKQILQDMSMYLI